MGENDRSVLRELGRQVAGIAGLPRQQHVKRQWKALNALRPERPMFTIDQIPWHEMDAGGELALRCEDGFLREIETGLRRRLYKWRHLRDDTVVEPFVDIPMAVCGLDFGINPADTTLALDRANDVVSHHYEDLLQTDEDLDKIKTPAVSLDRVTTSARQAIAEDIFHGILSVRMTGAGPLFFRPWDLISQWRGVMNPLRDLMDRPDFIHETLRRITEANLALLDQLEAQGLLYAVNDVVHCSGAWTDELPKPGFEPGRPRACDVWTCGMAQMFSTVSPAMHDEFEIQYAIPWYARFGLAYYGCCEPLDRKLAVIRKLPNVRKISMSPWADAERGAEAIGSDYVFSSKPNPAFLAVDSFSTGIAEADLRKTLDACRRHGTPAEFILKDVSTVRYEPQRLWKWAQMARGIAGD